MTKHYWQITIIFLSIFCFGLAYAEDTNQINVKESKLLIYKGQQVQIYDMMLDRIKKQKQLVNELPNLNYREMDFTFKKIDKLNEEIKELEYRLSELQLKVVDLAGGYPTWWNENEVAFQKSKSSQ